MSLLMPEDRRHRTLTGGMIGSQDTIRDSTPSSR
jgi:hypothetical protein